MIGRSIRNITRVTKGVVLAALRKIKSLFLAFIRGTFIAEAIRPGSAAETLFSTTVIFFRHVHEVIKTSIWVLRLCFIGLCFLLQTSLELGFLVFMVFFLYIAELILDWVVLVADAVDTVLSLVRYIRNHKFYAKLVLFLRWVNREIEPSKVIYFLIACFKSVAKFISEFYRIIKTILVHYMLGGLVSVLIKHLRPVALFVFNASRVVYRCVLAVVLAALKYLRESPAVGVFQGDVCYAVKYTAIGVLLLFYIVYFAIENMLWDVLNGLFIFRPLYYLRLLIDYFPRIKRQLVPWVLFVYTCAFRFVQRCTRLPMILATRVLDLIVGTMLADVWFGFIETPLFRLSVPFRTFGSELFYEYYPLRRTYVALDGVRVVNWLGLVGYLFGWLSRKIVSVFIGRAGANALSVFSRLTKSVVFIFLVLYAEAMSVFFIFYFNVADNSMGANPIAISQGFRGPDMTRRGLDELFRNSTIYDLSTPGRGFKEVVSTICHMLTGIDAFMSPYRDTVIDFVDPLFLITFVVIVAWLVVPLTRGSSIREISVKSFWLVYAASTVVILSKIVGILNVQRNTLVAVLLVHGFTVSWAQCALGLFFSLVIIPCFFIVRSGTGLGSVQSTFVFAAFSVLSYAALTVFSVNDFFSLIVVVELLAVVGFALLTSSSVGSAGIALAFRYFIFNAVGGDFIILSALIAYSSHAFLDFGRLVWYGYEVESSSAICGLILGLFFKIASMPASVISQSVYAQVPAYISQVFVVIVKWAYVGLLIRIVVKFGFGLNLIHILPIAATILLVFFVCAFGAFRSTGILGVILYSSAQQVSLAIIPLITSDDRWAIASSLFYSFTYILTIIGVFILISNGSRAHITDKVSGWQRISFIYLLLSLAGTPPFVGFFAKIGVFAAAASGGFVGLMSWILLFSVVSFGYYGRVVGQILFETNTRSSEMLQSRTVVTPTSKSTGIVGRAASGLVLVLFWSTFTLINIISVHIFTAAFYRFTIFLLSPTSSSNTLAYMLYTFTMSLPADFYSKNSHYIPSYYNIWSIVFDGAATDIFTFPKNHYNHGMKYSDSYRPSWLFYFARKGGRFEMFLPSYSWPMYFWFFQDYFDVYRAYTGVTDFVRGSYGVGKQDVAVENAAAPLGAIDGVGIHTILEVGADPYTLYEYARGRAHEISYRTKTPAFWDAPSGEAAHSNRLASGYRDPSMDYADVLRKSILERGDITERARASMSITE